MQHVLDARHALQAHIEQLGRRQLLANLRTELHLLEECAVVGGVVEEGRHAEVVHHCSLLVCYLGGGWGGKYP